MPVVSFQNGVVSGNAIGLEMFGAIITSHRNDDISLGPDDDPQVDTNPVNAFDAVADATGVTVIRFPGGTFAEEDFDWLNPENPDNETTLSDIVAYCAENGTGLAVIMPTTPFLHRPNEDELGTAESDPSSGDSIAVLAMSDEIRTYIHTVLQAAMDAGVTVTNIDIGNEFYDHMGASDYGIIASTLVSIVGEAIEDFIADNTSAGTLPANWEPPAIGIQVGRDTGFAETEAIFAEFSATEAEYVDGLVTHLLDRNPYLDGLRDSSFPGDTSNIDTRFAQFEHFESLDTNGIFGPLEYYTTAWSADATPQNMGRIIAVFHQLAENGATIADYYNVNSSTGGDLVSLGRPRHEDVRAIGELFRLMRENLVGTQAVEFSVADQPQTSDYDVRVFQSQSHTVIYVINRTGGALELDIDLSGLGITVGHVSGTRVGFEAGAAVDANDRNESAELEILNADQLDTDGDPYLDLTLNAHEVYQIVIANPGSGTSINGWHGDDSIVGSAEDDTLLGQDGNDTLLGHDNDDVLFGHDGNDSILGGRGYDTIRGNDGHDTIDGENGFDLLFGGTGRDVINGSNGNDTIRGNGGLDTIDGGSGNDSLFGGVQTDIINGGSGDDTISAGGGFDTIVGGTGNDVLTGDFNADHFVFADGHGNDTITDFEATNNAERIDLSEISSITSVDQLLLDDPNAGAATQVGNDVVIDTGNGNSITLFNVSITDLDAIDFTF